MRLLILANNSQGLNSFRGELIERLSSDHDVVFSVPEDSEDEDVKRLVLLGAKHVPCKYLSRRGTNPIEDVLLFVSYIILIGKIRPDMALTYTIKPNVYGGIACAVRRIPYVANVTGLGTAVAGGGAMQALTLMLYRLGFSRARKVFFQNESNRAFMLEHGLINVPNDLLPGSGVNTEKFTFTEYPCDEGDICFITIGRIMRDKGISELLDAARIIRERHSNVKFYLLGSFDEDWEGEVTRAVANGVVEYIPQQPDVRPYVNDSYALVHPSWHEGMSNVCLEAAAMGRPIIASNIPGCRETFDEGVSGISFEPRNVESLVSALEIFIEMPYEEKRKMGLAGHEKIVREFDRQIVINKYLEEISAVSKGDR